MNNKHGILFSGRLGNNLYALAAGFLYARKRKEGIYFYNKPDRFDIFSNSIYRKYLNIEIKNLNVGPLTNRDEVKKLCKDKNMSSYYSVTSKNPLPVKFLNDFISTIKPTEKIKQEINSKYSGIDEMISFHVRRGDYIKIKGCYTVDEKYLNDSIEIIKKKLDSNNFPILVFSDDIEWCKNNIRTKNEIYFFESKYFENDAYDLYAMSFCKHNIIANSSFSQWASYLNENKNKLVIYPERVNGDIIPVCKKFFYKAI